MGTKPASCVFYITARRQFGIHCGDILAAAVQHESLGFFRSAAGKAVLAHRWKAVRPYFLLQALLYTVFLACFCFSTVLIAKDDLADSVQTIYSGPLGRARIVLGVLCALLNLWFIAVELLEARHEGMRKYTQDVWNWINLATHLLVVVLVVVHLLRLHAQLPIAAVAAVALWFNLLAFSRGFRGTGVFTRIVFAVGLAVVVLPVGVLCAECALATIC